MQCICKVLCLCFMRSQPKKRLLFHRRHCCIFVSIGTFYHLSARQLAGPDRDLASTCRYVAICVIVRKVCLISEGMPSLPATYISLTYLLS